MAVAEDAVAEGAVAGGGEAQLDSSKHLPVSDVSLIVVSVYSSADWRMPNR